MLWSSIRISASSLQTLRITTSRSSCSKVLRERYWVPVMVQGSNFHVKIQFVFAFDCRSLSTKSDKYDLHSHNSATAVQHRPQYAAYFQNRKNGIEFSNTGKCVAYAKMLAAKRPYIQNPPNNVLKLLAKTFRTNHGSFVRDCFQWLSDSTEWSWVHTIVVHSREMKTPPARLYDEGSCVAAASQTTVRKMLSAAISRTIPNEEHWLSFLAKYPSKTSNTAEITQKNTASTGLECETCKPKKPKIILK